MIKLLLSLFALLAACNAIVANRKGAGITVAPGQFPYQVSIHEQMLGGSPHVCSGAIVAPTWVLTSAQCPYSKHFVEAGIIKLNDSTNHQKRDVKRFIQHPDFNATSLVNDIALIEIDEAFVYNNYVKKVNFPSEDFTSTKDRIITGWAHEQNRFREILQFTKAPITPEEVCKKEYRHHIPFKQECYGPLNEVCVGYHGDPIVQGDTIIGVASYTKATVDCDTEYPKIYTSVQMYMDFIRKYIPE